MNIIKRLSLNKTPKDIPNGSIACGKNIMIDDTGSFITNEIGFKIDFECPNINDNPASNEVPEKIVGVIPCNKEIVIFTTETKLQNNIPKVTDRIYRYPDNGSYYEVLNHSWRWSGGKITGSYTYNYKGDLIIAIGEYDANEDVPLKSINLDDIYDGTYALEEDIPQYDPKISVISNGNLICGVYTFFIRFKVDSYNYTKWFQISGDINIIQTALSKKYTHRYLNDVNNSPVLTTAGCFSVNTDRISNKAISVRVDFNGEFFTKCQLGYILKRNSEILGRLQGEYDITDNKIITIVQNNNYVEELSVDSILENPHQFFDVRNVINYNNRLYIANYKEYPIVSDPSSTKTVLVNNQTNNYSSNDSGPKPIVSTNNNTKVWNIELLVAQGWTRQSDGNGGYTMVNYLETVVNLHNIITDKDGYVLDNNSVIPYLTEALHSFDDFAHPHVWGNWDNKNFYWFLQNEKVNIDGVSANKRDDSICISRKINDEAYNPPPKWGWNFDIPDYSIKLQYVNATTVNITVEYGGKSWLLAGSTNTRPSAVLTFAHTESEDGKVKTDRWQYGDGNYTYSDPSFQAWVPYEIRHGETNYMPNDIRISSRAVSVETNNNFDVDNTTNPGSNDNSGDFAGGTVSTATGVNNRTLHPHQKYNFFVHFIRRDGSCTPGFPFNSLNSWTLVDGKNLIIPYFNVSYSGNDYIGYFISYEDIESTVDCVYLTALYDKILAFTNAQYLYDLDTIKGDKLFIGNNSGNSYIAIDKNTLTYIENRLTYNHAEINIGSSTLDSITKAVSYIVKNIDNIYNNKVKTLYRLTPNIYSFGTNSTAKQDYLPAFYTNEVIIRYKDLRKDGPAKGFIIDPASAHVIGFDNISGDDSGVRTLYKAIINEVNMYSPYPLSAMNIKQDFQQAAVSLHWVEGKDDVHDETYINLVVSPDKLHDLLELKACYTAKPSKSYTNFNEEATDTFDKTIYRSDVISDESLVNGFRHFGANEYKNILENKGKITNIVGVGLYFLVHTEYSLFVFDRNRHLTRQAQVDIPDVFDVKYQEVMPSNEGFGGLLDKEEAILTKHGYIWYDRTNKIIFSYEDGKVTMLSADINNFIKKLNVQSVRFAEDLDNSRLLICIKESNQSMQNPWIYITLSYNFNTKTFISLHDYKFTNNYRTYKKSYIFDSEYPRKLYCYDVKQDEQIADYKELYNTSSKKYFPVYINYYEVPGEDEEDEPTLAENIESYVDIIFTPSYEMPQVLEHINYVLNEVKKNSININNVVEEDLNRRYSGDVLNIYTDETGSGDLDIHIDLADLNKPSAYKYPYFEKGRWNLNYFRNLINTVIYNKQRAEAAISELPPTDLETYNSHGIPVPVTTPTTDVEKRIVRSDNKSLIYGKYFVVRFIFKNDKRVKLDTVNIATNPY